MRHDLMYGLLFGVWDIDTFGGSCMDTTAHVSVQNEAYFDGNTIGIFICY
jgi:hypothetical protein